MQVERVDSGRELSFLHANQQGFKFSPEEPMGLRAHVQLIKLLIQTILPLELRLPHQPLLGLLDLLKNILGFVREAPVDTSSLMDIIVT